MLSTALPHAQPRPAQVVAFGTHVPGVHTSHWKGWTTPQNSPFGQAPLPFTTAQSKVFAGCVPQPS
jgi:hypothetical protein